MTGRALPGGTSVERLHELDGWRGVLAIAVASYHFNVQALPVSYVAVDLFFMLSGFVLTHRYHDAIASRGDQARVAFVASRFRRLLPAHIIVLAAILLFTATCMVVGRSSAWTQAIAFEGGPVSAIYIAWDALLLNNIVPWDGSWGLNGASWSISVELWIGLGLLLFIGRRGRVALGIALSLSLLSYLVAWLSPGHLNGIKSIYVLWVNEGMVRGVGGMLLGYVSLHAWMAIRPRVASIEAWLFSAIEIAIAAGLIALLWQPEETRMDFAVLPLGVALLLTFASGRGCVSALLRNRHIQWLGSISFGVYLVHQPVLKTVPLGKDLPSLANYLVVVMALAALLTYLVARRTGDRRASVAPISPSGASSPAGAPPLPR